MKDQNSLNFAQRLTLGETPTEAEFDELISFANSQEPALSVHTHLGLTPEELALFLKHPYNKAIALLREHRGL